ncbi:MAG: outer membrane beta-barrel protein [Woeseiaceae bacterium]
MRSPIIPVLLLCFSLPAQAAGQYYFGARLGMSQYDGVADASRTAFVGSAVPNEISIDGLPFESDETAWGLYGGWRIKNWIALEIGFNDLGNTGLETFATFNGLSAFTTNSVSVDVEEIYLAARFTRSLSERWNANWTLGVSQAAFDTTGAVPLIVIPLFMPPSQRQPVPYATPDDEIGFIWGFGFGWEISNQWGLDIGYRQHDTQVFDVDTFEVAAYFSF